MLLFCFLIFLLKDNFPGRILVYHYCQKDNSDSDSAEITIYSVHISVTAIATDDAVTVLCIVITFTVMCTSLSH